MSPIRIVALGTLETVPEAMGMAVADGRAYVTGRGRNAPPGALEVIDIADPDHLVSDGALALPDIGRGVAVSGSVASVACQRVSGGGGVFRRSDVSDPAVTPVHRQREHPGYRVRRGAIRRLHSSEFAYVACGQAGLLVVSLADPTVPVVVGSVDTPGSARDVAVAGSFAYVADDAGGLLIIDVANPANPQIRGQVHPAYVHCRSVAVDGARAYVGAYYTEQGFGGLSHDSFSVIDVSDPSAPRIEGSIASGGLRWVSEIAVSGAHRLLRRGLWNGGHRRRGPGKPAAVGRCVYGMGLGGGDPGLSCLCRRFRPSDCPARSVRCAAAAPWRRHDLRRPCLRDHPRCHRS